MADKTIRISELPSSGSNTAGLYTIGVNASNESVKVPLGDILASAHGEVMFADLDKLCTVNDMLQGKPACYTVLDTLQTSNGTVTLKVGVLWVYSDNMRHVVMQVLNTNFVLDDDGTISGNVHNHDVHEYSRTYAYSTAAGTLHTWTKWQEVGGKGIVDRITNVALAKQDKLVAGDDATRLNGAKLSTKQIFTGSVDATAGAVPTLLPDGGCIYNSSDKKLYIGNSNNQPVEVAKPDDFLFFDTSTNKSYHFDGSSLTELGSKTWTEEIINNAIYTNEEASRKPTYMQINSQRIDFADFPTLNPMLTKKFSILTCKQVAGSNKDFKLFICQDDKNYVVIKYIGWVIQIHVVEKGALRVLFSSVCAQVGANAANVNLLCYDFVAGLLKIYSDGVLTQSITISTDLPDFQYSYMVYSSTDYNLGFAIGSSIYTDAQALEIYNNSIAGKDYLVRDDYVGDAFEDGVWIDGEITKSVTGSSDNAYVQHAGSITQDMQNYQHHLSAHIIMTKGSITPTGFDIHGVSTVNIIDSDGNDLGTKVALEEGKEYDLVYDGIVNAGANNYLLNFTHTADARFELSKLKKRRLGFPVICSINNYTSAGFKQGNGQMLPLPTSYQKFYDTFKPTAITSNSPVQFLGQLYIDASGNVYVGVINGLTRTWKKINNA